MDAHKQASRRVADRIVTAVALLLGCVRSLAIEAPATQPAGRTPPLRYELLISRGERPDINDPVVDHQPVFRACFDAKGVRLLAAMANEVRVYNVPAMTPAMKPLTVKPHVEAAELSADGTLLLIADGDGWLRVRRIPSDKPLWERHHAKGYEWVVFTPDGKSVMVIELDGKAIRRLDASTGRETLVITDATSEHFLFAALSEDGSRVMATGIGPAHVWSTDTGKLLATVNAHGSNVAISPTGDRFMGQANPWEMDIYDTARGEKLSTTGWA